MSSSDITKLFNIKYPIIQAGMVWVSGAKLAAAAANTGILGLIGAGSMSPELLRSQIRKAKLLTKLPFGVNVPLLYKAVEEQISVSLEEGVKIFFTSAGSPQKYTTMLKNNGCVVVHVTSTPALAVKCQDAGVDAVVAEGFEAGGHNGRDELTSMVLTPQVVESVKIPVITAGGISSGKSMAAALSLGACGVQIGSRFVATVESSAHLNFKHALLGAAPNSTALCMKGLVPVRLLKNKFYEQIRDLEARGASSEELTLALGKGRAKRGMLEGDLDEGELEIGQVASLIKDIPTCSELVARIISEYNECITQLKPLS